MTTAVRPWVKTKGRSFVDQSGAKVVLRGFNAQGWIKKAIEMGVNFIRLPIYWDEIEPNPPAGTTHSWNNDRLIQMENYVNALQAANINVLIDFHQSGWSDYFSAITGKGHGLPSWLYSDAFFPFPATSKGLSAARKDWFTNDAYLPYWYAFVQVVVEQFRGYPNVVGYEVFNEPQPGALGQNHLGTQTIIEWQAARAKFIKTLDKYKTIFIFTRQGGDLGWLNADFSPFGSTMQGYALDYHDYFTGTPAPAGWSTDTETWYPSHAATHIQDQTTPYVGTYEDQLRTLDQLLAKTKVWNMPLLVGEWGAMVSMPGVLEYQADLLRAFRTRKLSWARWALTASGGLAILNADGSNTPVADQIAAELKIPV